MSGTSRDLPADGDGDHIAPGPTVGTTEPCAAGVPFDGPCEDPPPCPDGDAPRKLGEQFSELGEYAAYYLAAKSDSLRLAIRKVLFRGILAALGLVLVASLSVVASLFILSGMAEGLAVLCGTPRWVGNLLTGVLCIGGLWGGLYGVARRGVTSARDRKVTSYENRQQQQQTRYGRNVGRGAAAGEGESQ